LGTLSALTASSENSDEATFTPDEARALPRTGAAYDTLEGTADPLGEVEVDGEVEFVATLSFGQVESHRVLRRLHFLREWSHEQEQ